MREINTSDNINMPEYTFRLPQLEAVNMKSLRGWLTKSVAG